MLRPVTRARNARLTQPLGPRSRARPDDAVSGGVPPGGGVCGGPTGWVSGIDAEPSSVAERPSEFVPVAVAVLSANVWPDCVAMAQEYVHVSPGSSVASPAFAPVRCSSHLGSS